LEAGVGVVLEHGCLVPQLVGEQAHHLEVVLGPLDPGTEHGRNLRCRADRRRGALERRPEIRSDRTLECAGRGIVADLSPQRASGPAQEGVEPLRGLLVGTQCLGEHDRGLRAAEGRQHALTERLHLGEDRPQGHHRLGEQLERGLGGVASRQPRDLQAEPGDAVGDLSIRSRLSRTVGGEDRGGFGRPAVDVVAEEPDGGDRRSDLRCPLDARGTIVDLPPRVPLPSSKIEPDDLRDRCAIDPECRRVRKCSGGYQLICDGEPELHQRHHAIGVSSDPVGEVSGCGSIGGDLRR
jgi:hypothetical protein